MNMRHDPKIDTTVQSSPANWLVSALRIVLTVSLSRAEAATFMTKLTGEDADDLWSSTVYHWLSYSMLSSSTGWAVGSLTLDQILSRELNQFVGHSPDMLVQNFHMGQGVWDTEELAALLWTLLRKQDPSLHVVLRRLAQEIETMILQAGVPLKIRVSRPLVLLPTKIPVKAI